MVDIRHEADIVFPIFILWSTQLLIKFLISSNNFQILLILEQTPRYFGIPFKLDYILLQCRRKRGIVRRWMNCCMRKHSETFILSQHHQGDPKPSPIASDLQDVICVFKLLPQLLDSLAPHHRAAILKSRNLIQLKQSYL